MKSKLFAAIEAGGTKFICTVGSSPSDLRERVRIPTTTPQETLGACISYIAEQQKSATLSGVGVSCFGPLDLNPKSPGFGSITKTPKAGWSDVNIRKIISEAVALPVTIDTDVNGAVLAEHLWGAAQDIDNALYLTIGTGIGGGALVNGALVHGLVHPEMGHVRVRRDPSDSFAGLCRFHADCFEGLASGPAMKARWNSDAEHLPHDHPAWELEAEYIAQALSNFIFVLSPERIILGGGVVSNEFIFPMIRRKVLKLLAGYVVSPTLTEQIDSYIVPQGCHGDAGVLGAIALASQAV